MRVSIQKEINARIKLVRPEKFFLRSFNIAIGFLCSFATAQDSGEKKIDNDDFVGIEYNPAFIHGVGIDLSRFKDGNTIEPGVHNVFVTVNDTKSGEHAVLFKKNKKNDLSKPYFTSEELRKIGIKLNPENIQPENIDTREDLRFTLESAIKDSLINYDAGDYQLDITVPQANIIYRPRGFTPPDQWDAGVPAVFLDYSTILYRNYKGSRYGERTKNIIYTGNVGVQTGFNALGWRFRKRFNMSMASRGNSKLQSLSAYAQTDVIRLRSQMTIGESNTRGDVFDSYNIRGILLQSDTRMLPDGLKSYAPVLRGIAETNAKITVIQREQTIYETVVPPGPFEINDIGSMGYGGDLKMIVTESDGRVKSQIIPFSAPPMLLHPGVSLFSVGVGELIEERLRKKPKVIQGVYHYGVGNLYTLYGGTQIANNYYSMSLGNAFNTPVGGISVDATHAISKISDTNKRTGNSFKIGFSRYLEATNTDVTLAAYRYSTAGYYTFREASLERYYRDGNLESDYRAKQRMTLNVGQRLWNDAYINFTGSAYKYWDDRANTKQYSLTYNKSEKYFSYALTAMKSMNSNHKNENSYMLSFSIPLGGSISDKPVFNSLYSTLSNTEGGDSSLQISANGSQGEMNELTYGIGTITSKGRHQGTKETVSGNAFYRSPMGYIGMTASADNQSTTQVSLSANGSLVGHQGGITAGPALGDTPFAIIQAPGGKGARIFNGYGAKIDSRGYAIMPSLTAYRENRVSVDSRGLPATVDVLESESTVVPRTGSAILVNMKTIVGTPYILIVKLSDDSYLPIGTELFNEEGINQGVVGQGGMAFIRGWDPTVNTLKAKWDEGKNHCKILPNKKWITPSVIDKGMIVTLEVKCVI